MEASSAAYPDIACLKNLAAEDIFVRIPRHPQVPTHLYNRVVHSRHLLRYVGRAVSLLEEAFEDRKAAANEDSMAWHYVGTSMGRVYGRWELANSLRIGANLKRVQAEELLQAVAKAEILN
ncbi:MAG: hypothetical protein GC129_06000 [Proteobacteria bacterium]|nr:hypothetical protein [Pseudomonadota bacterium]